MSCQFLIAASLFALPAFAFDEATLTQAAALRDAALKDNTAYETVEGLVQTAPYRFAGSANGRKAVVWAEARLKALGFSNVHTEAVTVPQWLRGSAAVRIVSGAQAELVAVALGGSVGTAKPVVSEVLMVNSLDELRARPLSEIKNKIVFFNGRMERKRDGSGYSPAVAVRSKGAAEAARRGALGVVIRSIGTNHDRDPHTGALRYDEIVRKIPAAALSAIDADLLEARLQSGERLRLSLYLTARDAGKALSANVIGEIPGETDEIVLLAAHLDSWDITPGANDDGAGVAIISSAARLIGALGKKPRRTIRVLLTANEEFGLSGAKAYALAHAAEIPRHVLGLEADFGSGAVFQLASGVPEAMLAQVQATLPLLAPFNISYTGNNGTGGADLSPLREQGMPVLEPRQDGTVYFDVHHTKVDTLDKIDREGLKQNVAVYSVLAYLASQGL